MAELSQCPVDIWTRENSGEGMLYLQRPWSLDGA